LHLHSRTPAGVPRGCHTHLPRGALLALMAVARHGADWASDVTRVKHLGRPSDGLEISAWDSYLLGSVSVIAIRFRRS
jgi:hypothetical protein